MQLSTFIKKFSTFSKLLPLLSYSPSPSAPPPSLSFYFTSFFSCCCSFFVCWPLARKRSRAQDAIYGRPPPAASSLPLCIYTARRAGNWHPIAKCLCLWHSSSRCWHWHSSWNCSWLPLLALAMTKAYWQIIQPLAHIAAIVWRQRATITKETTTRTTWTIEGRATNMGGGGQQINRKVEQIEKRFKQIIKKVANIKTRRATSDDEVLPNVLVG